MPVHCLTDFGIGIPALLYLGLNPHAGDDGLLGSEEKEVITPAIKGQTKGITALGPFAADGFFGAGRFSRFDAVLAMYHDQGLTPFKVTKYGEWRELYGRLPVVRTSPAHGTAFELAGKNEASPASFRNALYLAIDVARSRKLYDEIASNPLPVPRPITGEGRIA